MREPFHQLHVHLIWATWDRLPILSPERSKAIYACIQAECTTLKAEVIAIGSVEDHVHLLVRYPPMLDVSKLVQQVKGASSHLMTYRVDVDRFFKWQGAYAAYAISKSEIPRVRNYILNQEEHHRNKTIWPDFEMPE